jgi:hypothetical protein
MKDPQIGNVTTAVRIESPGSVFRSDSEAQYLSWQIQASKQAKIHKIKKAE